MRLWSSRPRPGRLGAPRVARFFFPTTLDFYKDTLICRPRLLARLSRTRLTGNQDKCESSDI